MIEIVVPFAIVDSINPNVKAKTYDKALSIYYKTICVCFFSLKKFNPDTKLIFLTNVYPPKRYSDFLNYLKVEIKIREYSFIPPAAFGPLFRGSFYLLDAIEISEGPTLFIDPDVMCVKKIPLERLNKNLMCLEMPFESHENLNGISRFEAQKIFSRYSGKKSETIQNHLGGECIFIGNGMERFKDEIRRLWEYNYNLDPVKGNFLPTEEHLLSLLASSYNYSNLEFLIERIWTGYKYRLIPNKKQMNELSLLHLPAEKSKGFRQFFWLVSNFPNFFYRMKKEYFIFFVFWKFHLYSIKRNSFFHFYRFFSNHKIKPRN
jgi:hypothetical protein